MVRSTLPASFLERLFFFVYYIYSKAECKVVIFSKIPLAPNIGTKPIKQHLLISFFRSDRYEYIEKGYYARLVLG